MARDEQPRPKFITDRVPDLTPALIEELKAKGLNQAEIAELTQRSQAAVSWRKIRHGNYSRTPREIVRDDYPWHVDSRFRFASWNRLMQNHGEYMATGGDGMDEYKLDRLEAFWTLLHAENRVVEYDPDIPPLTTGPRKFRNKVGGFALRERTPEDGDLIVRRNEHTTVTEDGERTWTFPPHRRDA